MNCSELLENLFLNLLVTVAGILLVLWVERQRRPRLTFSTGQEHYIAPDDFFDRTQMKWIRVLVRNRNVPNWLAWVYDGEPALTCRAFITFYSMDFKKLSVGQFTARWSGTTEPRIEVINVENKGFARRLVGVEKTYDIIPGESTHLDIAVRSKTDPYCYSWVNESYLLGWNDPKFLVGCEGRYLVKVVVRTGGHEYIDAFLIINDEGYERFRVEPVDKNTKKKMLKV